MRNYNGAGKLDGKIALVTGGDSGIGRAVAIGFAKEGADVAITYLNEHDDAQETVRLIEAEGRRALAMAGDIGDADFCNQIVQRAVQSFGRIDILVNNAAEQHLQPEFEKLSDEQLERTCRGAVLSENRSRLSMSETRPPQSQNHQPGQEHEMHPRPRSEMRGYK
ncbi:MAG TPA: SDR family NAD(P)-dependent oxidoreductase, partial [Acetobacteraceae bacterium]